MQDDIETRVIDLWKVCLKRPSINKDEDFFALGGNSLNGIKLLEMVEQTFDVEVPPLAMYDDASTPSGMAEIIRGLLSRRATKA